MRIDHCSNSQRTKEKIYHEINIIIKAIQIIKKVTRLTIR